MFQVCSFCTYSRSRLTDCLGFEEWIVIAFQVLKRNPAPVPEYDAKKLRGLKDIYRIRIGDIRMEYEVEW